MIGIARRATPHQHTGTHCDAAAPATRHLGFQCATVVSPRSLVQQASALPTLASETYTAHFTAAPAV